MTAPEPYSLSSVDPAAWDGLLRGFPKRTVFHGLGWLGAVQQAHRVKPHLLQASGPAGCAALWPFFTTRKGPLRIVGSPLPGWSTVYLGPLFAADADVPAAMRAFFGDRTLARAAYAFVKVLDAHQEVDLQPFGFQRRSRYRTYLLALERSEDELWGNLSGKCRNMVRKGQKAGLEVRVERTPEFMDDFWAMSEEVFARSQIQPTFSRALLERVWDHLHPQGALLVLSAFHEQQRVATLVLPHDDRTIHYWQGASFARFRALSPNNMLQWEAIRHARRMGLRTYDFVSVYGGPGKFKRSFGPQEHAAATHWERSRSRVVRLLKTLYERRVLRRRRT